MPDAKMHSYQPRPVVAGMQSDVVCKPNRCASVSFATSVCMSSYHFYAWPIKVHVRFYSGDVGNGCTVRVIL